MQGSKGALLDRTMSDANIMDSVAGEDAAGEEMTPLRVVIIEDEEAHFQLMKRAINKGIPAAAIHYFDDPCACLDNLDAVNPDVIIVDYIMPGMNGIEFLHALKRVTADIPVIVVTGQGNENIAVQAMKLGASDYLVKTEHSFTLLPSLVAKVVRERKLRSTLRESIRLNEMLLNSLPHPAMLIRPDRVILAANRIALELGAKIGGYCWREFAHCQNISDRDRDPLEKYGEPLPPGAQCTFCLLDKAVAEGSPVESAEICLGGRSWNIWWIPVDRETFLHYAIDITTQKIAEKRIRKLSQQLIKAQEDERRKLSCELHDTIGQDLSYLKIGIQTLLDDRESAQQKSQKISQLSKMLQESIKTVRNLAYHLRPVSLDQLGLVRTVQEYCEDFESSCGVHVDFFAAGLDDLELDFDTGITLYRLIQEALTNVKKHAQARHVTIRLVASFPSIILHVEDDGIGFDIQKRLGTALDERRMGLRSMKERVGLLDGKMQMESRSTRGTKIRIEVPYRERADGSQEKNLDC